MASIMQRLYSVGYDWQYSCDEAEDERDIVDTSNSETDRHRQMKIAIVRSLCAECLGVTLYVFIGCMAIPHPHGFDPGLKQPGAGAIHKAVSHGLGLVFLTMALVKISGAHLNPAVTLGVLLCGEIHPAMALAYVFIQLLGGVIGAALCRAILPHDVYLGINGGAYVLHVTPGEGVSCEMIVTCVVVLTYILVVIEPTTKSARAPIAVGFSVLACTLSAAAVTGGAMNPARSFGPAVAMSIYNKDVWQSHYVYWLGPVLGALAAVLLYRFMFASQEKLLLGKCTRKKTSTPT